MPRRPEQDDLWAPPHPSGYAIPTWAERPADNAQPSPCRSCSSPVLWVRTVHKKWAPLNSDGTSHFSTCPDAENWRKRT